VQMTATTDGTGQPIVDGPGPAPTVAAERRRTRGHRAGMLAGSLAAAVVVVSCSSSHKQSTAVTTSPSTTAAAAATTASPPTSAAAPPDPCTLVSLQDAEAITTIALQAGVPAGPGGVPTNCTYTSPPTGETAQVTVVVGDGAKKILDVDRSLNHTITAIAGVGDEAWEEDDNVFVRKGQTWAAISLVRLNDASANRVPLETAIKLVASRLP